MKKTKLKGFSIVEIMLAITLSLILILGVLQIFVTNKNAYRLESSFSVLQENARFANDYLSKLIRNSGYRSARQGTMFASLPTIFAGGNGYIGGSNASGPNHSDTLIIRFQGSGDGAGTSDGSIRDCLNQPVDAFTTATNTLSINANYELECRSQNSSASTTDQTKTILPDVENMQILYGEDLTGDKNADRFVPANHPNLNFDNVVAIRISLLLRSEDQTDPISNNNTYNLLGTIQTATGDNHIRQAVTFTITLRNAITEVLI